METITESSSDFDLSLVIPTHNSSRFLAETVQCIVAIVARDSVKYEILIVDDGSTDDTWLTIVNLAVDNPRVRGIRLRDNSGQHCATLCGIRHSTGSVVVTLDDDLQHSPEFIPQLLVPLKNGEFDAVFAVFQDLRTGLVRKIGSRVIQGVYRWLGLIDSSLNVSSFRSMSRSVADAVSKSVITQPVVNAEIARVAGRVTNVPLPHGVSLRGKSGYSFKQIARLSRQILFSYSSKPLLFGSRIATLAGACIGGFMGIVLLRAMILGSKTPGWVSIMAVVSFSSLPVLFVLAIIAEYLALLLGQNREDSLYVIRGKVSLQSKTVGFNLKTDALSPKQNINPEIN